jgi:hypothetical protein
MLRDVEPHIIIRMASEFWGDQIAGNIIQHLSAQLPHPARATESCAFLPDPSFRSPFKEPRSSPSTPFERFSDITAHPAILTPMKADLLSSGHQDSHDQQHIERKGGAPAICPVCRPNYLRALISQNPRAWVWTTLTATGI